MTKKPEPAKGLRTSTQMLQLKIAPREVTLAIDISLPIRLRLKVAGDVVEQFMGFTNYYLRGSETVSQLAVFFRSI